MGRLGSRGDSGGGLNGEAEAAGRGAGRARAEVLAAEERADTWRFGSASQWSDV